ncbi:hypothetical protein SRHO_G00104800 [Serrasalmus rhombeus]
MAERSSTGLMMMMMVEPSPALALTLPAEVREKLAELELELSEGKQGMDVTSVPSVLRGGISKLCPVYLRLVDPVFFCMDPLKAFFIWVKLWFDTNPSGWLGLVSFTVTVLSHAQCSLPAVLVQIPIESLHACLLVS